MIILKILLYLTIWLAVEVLFIKLVLWIWGRVEKAYEHFKSGIAKL